MLKAIGLMIIRMVIALLAIIPLFFASFYATIKKLDYLPWGLDPWFGNKEDGWNGNGYGAEPPRHGWLPNEWGKWVGTDRGVQGWWPDHLKVNWHLKSTVYKWFRSFQWCALRNKVGNGRWIPWLSTHTTQGIDFKFKGNTYDFSGDSILKGDETKWFDVVFTNEEGTFPFKYRAYKVGSLYIGFVAGWKIYPTHHIATTKEYKRIKKWGYTGGYTHLSRSVPTFRPIIKRPK